MFVGSDWKGTKQWNEFEKQFSKYNVEIVYLPHTDGISSTKLTSVIKEILDEKPEENNIFLIFINWIWSIKSRLGNR